MAFNHTISRTLSATIVALGVVGALAGWLSAFRASQLDPAKVLRDN
jgi:ABC-type antimicrobial peptide transport system permease subunit